MLACLSISETTLECTPHVSSNVAHVCLKSWKRMSDKQPEEWLPVPVVEIVGVGGVAPGVRKHEPALRPGAVRCGPPRVLLLAVR
jgi:hypothetical protein